MMRVSQDELNEVKAAMDAEKKVRVFKRYQAVYLFLSGKTCRDVAEIVGITKQTVSILHKTYKSEGLQGLQDKPISGRPSRLTADQLASLKEVILNKVPVEVGFTAEFNWTAGLIAKYIERDYGYNYSIRGITGMLGRLGLSYTRPTYVLAKADKQKQEHFVQEFETVKKTAER